MGITELTAAAFMLSGAIGVYALVKEMAGRAVTIDLLTIAFLLACFLLGFGLADVAVDNL